MFRVLIALFFLLLLFPSCKKANYKNGEFFVENKCSFIVEVYATKTVLYKGEPHSESYYAKVNPAEIVLVNKAELKDDFEIRQYFSKINIYKGDLNSRVDGLIKSNWTEKLLGDEDVQYTLSVGDDSF